MKKSIVTILLAAAMPWGVFAEEKKPFLGVATKAADESLKAQLGLPNGVVVVDVIEDGPASGHLEAHDVLLQADSQMLINPEQLTGYIASKKKGDQVEVRFVRKGKESTSTITLGERSAQKSAFEKREIGGFGPGVQIFPMDGQPKEVEIMIQDIQKQMEKQMQSVKKGGNPGIVIRTGPNSVSQGSVSAMTVWSENGVTYQMGEKDGVRTVKVTDGGKVIFDGECNSKDDLQKIPEEYRKKIEAIQSKVIVFTHEEDTKKEPKGEKRDRKKED